MAPPIISVSLESLNQNVHP